MGALILQVTDAAVKNFIEERPGMSFVGLLATDAGFTDFLSGEGNLKVGTTFKFLIVVNMSALKVMYNFTHV